MAARNIPSFWLILRLGLLRYWRQFVKSGNPSLEVRHSEPGGLFARVFRACAVGSKGDLAVEKIVELMATGWSEKPIVENYPGLTHDDMCAGLCYATEILKSERVVALASPE